jgi:hypothetical protein
MLDIAVLELKEPVQTQEPTQSLLLSVYIEDHLKGWVPIKNPLSLNSGRTIASSIGHAQ